MNKTDLLAAIRRDRAALDVLVARIDGAHMTEPVLEGGWSVKDVLAHIAAWEELCLTWLSIGVRAELTAGDEFGAQVDALNARLYGENRDRPLADIRDAYTTSHAAIVAATNGLDDSALASRPAWAPHAQLWQIIDANSAEHYREHIDQLTRWLDGDG